MTNEEILNEEWTLSLLTKAISELCTLEWLTKHQLIANQFEYSRFYSLVNKIYLVNKKSIN